MHPARRRLGFLSAAIAAIAAVLAQVLPARPASAATSSAAGNGVGVSHPGACDIFDELRVALPDADGQPGTHASQIMIRHPRGYAPAPRMIAAAVC